MRYSLVMFSFAVGCVAVDSAEEAENANLSEAEQAVWDGSGEAEGETVIIQGGLDSCWAGLCWPSNWPTDPGPGYTGDDGPGGGRGPGGDPGDHGGPGGKPARKNCTDVGKYPDVESCKQCCFYNNDHVDGWTCRRKKTPAARAKCWREANEKMGKCNRQCEEDRVVITAINPIFP